MPDTSAARLKLTIWRAASAVGAVAAAGAVWSFAREGTPAAILPFAAILVVTGLLAWRVTRVAGLADRHLRTAEDWLEAAAEALPDGLVVFDRHDRIAFFNSR